jgi:hypothetical protein
MEPKYKIGDLVSVKHPALSIELGIVQESFKGNKDLIMLWGEDTWHYQVKDIKNGEYVSAVEGILEPHEAL